MRHKDCADKSLRFVSIVLLIAVFLVIGRLFVLQILDGKYYLALALDTQEIYKQLYPRRGNIYMQDTRDNKEYPVAINRPYYLVYAVPRDMLANEIVSSTNFLVNIFGYSESEKETLLKNLSKKDDPYEPIAKKVSEDKINKLKQANIKGIHYISQEYRYYPEGNSMASVVGFVGSDENGDISGKYGVEGAWEKDLAGQDGFLYGMRGAFGGLIPLANRTTQQAENGADLVLTIDRSLQYQACKALKDGFITYKAKSASIVMLDVETGAVLAMCSEPDYDPNNYAKVTNVNSYNNTAIFDAYEPGSVIKPITMAIALDLGLVTPNTRFTDPGVLLIDGFKIYNALKASYGNVNMTEVLEDSINTGIIWVAEKIGNDKFKEYMEKFGFGKKTGIVAGAEVAGDISSFSKTAKIYNANASFGQGFTATTLQLAVAYASLANGGKIVKPYIVKEVRRADGRIEKKYPEVSDMVISTHAQKLISGMLVSVVENGHGQPAKLDKYYLAGKTGTAQIAENGEYIEATNHTFTGFFPVENPKVALVVRYEAPQRLWAESTVAPLFKIVAQFTLNYFGIKNDK
jgi:cell division protein FtsI/penicillin-binding protein 2